MPVHLSAKASLRIQEFPAQFGGVGQQWPLASPFLATNIKQQFVHNACREDHLECPMISSLGQGDDANSTQRHSNPVFAFPSRRVDSGLENHGSPTNLKTWDFDGILAIRQNDWPESLKELLLLENTESTPIIFVW
jgi:hypothetical protein